MFFLHPPTPRRSAFTLVELLVVVSVIGALAALGLATARTVVKNARATKCLNSVRHIGVAIRAYVTDHDGRLPDTSHVRAADGSSLSWRNTLAVYLGENFLSRCPENARSPFEVTYAWNDLLTENSGAGIPAARCQTPGATLAVGEIADSHSSEHFHFAAARNRVTYNQFTASVAVNRHGKGANYLFADGHAERLTPDEAKTRLTATDSNFLKP